jgi:hypothetical protein
MAGKLVTNVFVDGNWYGPNDRVPAEVAEQITNPKAWAETPAPEPKADPSVADVKEPPRGGPGSSADAWRAFMVSQQFEVPEGASAKDMQAAWDNRDKG